MTLNKLEKLRLKQFVNSKGSENINSKIAALFAVAVMITAGFIIVADVTDSDAKVVDDDYDAIHIKKGVSHNVTLFTDEYQYVNYGYTLTWYIAKNPNAFDGQADLDKMEFTNKLGTRVSETYTPVDEGVIIGNVTFKITERNYNTSFGNVGEYNLNISAGENATTPGYIAIKCEVNVKLDENTTYPVENLYYLYQITVDESTTYTLNELTFTQGINGSQLISCKELIIGNYDWYATGLPAGLSMDKTGKVSGTPHNTATTADSVKVVGTLKVSPYTTVEAEMVVTINEATTGGIILRLNGDVVTVEDAKQYATELGSNNVKLTVSTGSNQPYDVLTVRIVDSDGNVYVIDSTNDKNTEFDIVTEDQPIKGTGIYRIYVTAVVDSEKQTEYVDLYVLGNLDSVFAEIIVSGA